MLASNSDMREALGQESCELFARIIYIQAIRFVWPCAGLPASDLDIIMEEVLFQGRTESAETAIARALTSPCAWNGVLGRFDSQDK